MTDMKLSKSEAKEAVEATSPDEPRYPYGLSISLDSESIEKLDLKSLPKVGDKLKLSAVVEVTQVSQHESDDGVNRSVGLQITDMELGSNSKDRAEILYSKES